MRLRRIVTFCAAVLLVAAIGGGTAVADSPGTLLYRPASPAESNAYARAITLQHAGKYDGRLLATFEHWTNDHTPARFTIRDSDDNGRTWSTLATIGDPQTGAGHPVTRMWQPFLYEFPHQLGRYPAGTLLLVGNMVPDDGSYTEFFSWRSTDHGRTWKPVAEWQRGGPGGKGIWEPFLSLDRSGRLVAYFSDERDFAHHSQMLVHVVSTDGGDHWGPLVRDVASSVTADRPGMVTVARMGARGRYVMSYEVCGRPNCEVRYKYSDDADHWNATNLGQRAETTDGRYFGHSPYLAWSPDTRQLVLAGQSVYSVVGNQETGESGRAVFLNSRGGRGPWSWAPAPWHVSPTSADCNHNYSPNLMPLAHGGLRYTAPTSVGSSGPCGEATGTAPTGVLPYRADFAGSGDAGWADYGGCWSVRGDVYSTSCGGDVGAKALTGSTGWTDYTVAADLQITSKEADAGLLARVSDPAVGPDSHNGYHAAIDLTAGTLTIARQQYAYEPLVSATVHGGLSANTWYHLTLAVHGYRLTATLRPADGGPTTTVAVTDPYRSFGAGMVGLRDHAGTAAFRNVTVRRS